MTNQPETGTCPACGRTGLRIRKNHTVWNHGNGITSRNHPRYGQNCPGAGRPPAPATEAPRA
jgi:hypothetical protein